MSTAESSNEEKVTEPPPIACKKIVSITPEIKCLLCGSAIDDPVNLGEVYEVDNIICHYYCLLLSSSLVQTGADHEGIYGFLPKDIQKEVRRGSRLRCSYCKQKGASIGCTVKSCRIMFHLPCGLKHGSLHQFFDRFLSFCSSHRPHQKVGSKFLKLLREDEDAKICPICYDPVGNKVSNDTLWAPCCRKRWFHRTCVQHQALAQGYFFKCPMCNNKDKFNVEMKEFGIYIPEMDAAWEREPQAFQDLLHIHKECDAKNCQCPDGRSFTQNTGSWRLLRCNSCGHKGTHIMCSGLKISAASNSWSCSFCARILHKGKGQNIQDVIERRSTSTRLLPDSPSPSTSSGSSTISSISSPSPITLSRSSTISSSQRRRPSDVEFEQDRKRRKSSRKSTNPDTNNVEKVTSEKVKEQDFPEEVQVLVKVTTEKLKEQVTAEKLKEQVTAEKLKEQVLPEKLKEQITPGKLKEQEATTSTSDEKSVSDEDEIVVVDDDDDGSDIEVVDIQKRAIALRTYPVSSELLTKEGKTIKVHKVSAEGHSVPLEIGSLGAVNMRPAEPSPSLIQSGTGLPKSKRPKKSDSVSHSTTSTSTRLQIQNVCSISKPSSLFVTDPNDVNDASSTLGIKIGDVRHSDELFSTTRKEEGVENTQIPTTLSLPNANLLALAKQLMYPVQELYLLPVQTANGQTLQQPYIPVKYLSQEQQQQLFLAQQKRAAAKEKAQTSPPDVVTLD